MGHDTSLFYKHLPTVTSFADVFHPDNHQPIPQDWFIIISDIVNSTQAIKAGRYKDVNIAGGLVAMAISNAYKDMDFPFIFGGDGMTCLIPPKISDSVRDILYDTHLKVDSFFKLNLRVGMVRLSEIYSAGYSVTIAKLEASRFYNQAIVQGEGLSYAESLVKGGEDNPYLIQDKKVESVEADFTGFTCRWKDIPSSKGETISTIIKLRDEESQAAYDCLTNILTKIRELFGEEKDYHPITKEHLNLAQSEEYLGREALVTSGQPQGLAYFRHLIQFRIEALVTWLALKLRLPVQSNWYDLRKLKGFQIASSDYKKYDGSLKLVINCKPEARQKWSLYLEEMRQKGLIYYGLHIADRAIMTCLLHEGSTREVHFVDAADGGYAMAASQLKSQMRGV